MKNQDLQIIYFLFLIIIGISLASEFHNKLTQPIESITSSLGNIMHYSDPIQIRTNLLQIQSSLDMVMEIIPEKSNTDDNVLNKNPVWIYPTESTNFLWIQNDVDIMITNIEKTSQMSKDTSAYHVGMMDINNRATNVKNNIVDTIPYMYNNPENIISNPIWLIGVMGITEILIRKSYN